MEACLNEIYVRLDCVIDTSTVVGAPPGCCGFRYPMRSVTRVAWPDQSRSHEHLVRQ